MARGPGSSNEVGRVSIRVVPDTSEFRQKVRAHLESMEKDFEVSMDLNTERARAKYEAFRQRVERNNLNVDIRANTTQATTNITRMHGRMTLFRRVASRVQPVFVGISSSINRVSVGLDRMNTRVRSARDGFREVADQTQRWSDLTIRSNRNGIRLTRILGSGLGLLSGLLSSVSQGMSTFARAALRVAPLLANIATAVLLLIGLVAILVPLIAALSGAFLAVAGAIAAGFAGLPVIIFTVLAPLGAVLLSLDKIGEAAAGLQKPFNALRETVGNAFVDGLGDTFDTIADIITSIEKPMAGLARTTGNFARILVDDLFGGAENLQRLETIIDNVSVALDVASVGIRDFLNSMLDVASQTSLFEILGQTINGILSRFAAWFQKISANGELQAGLTNVRDLLFAVADALIGILGNGLRFFNAAASGINSFFASLTGFFSRVNWERLGSAFGRIFKAIGDWLDDLPQSAINNITDAIIDLSNAVVEFIQAGGLDLMIAGFGLATKTAEIAVDAFTIFRGAVGALQAPFRRIGGVFNSVTKWIGDNARRVVGFFRGMPGTITGLFFGLGSILWDAGAGIINGLWNGMVTAWNNVTGWLSGLGSTIASIKGPEEYDKQLLVDPGIWIMEGLQKGLLSEMGDLEATIDTVTNAIHNPIATDGTPALRPDSSDTQGLFDGLTDDVVRALEGWTVEIDQDGVARMVNRSNQRMARRK